MSKVAEVNQKTEEPRFEMKLPDSVRSAEMLRRDFMMAGCDWAHGLVQFLRGQRAIDIQPDEIVETLLYLRSDETEKKALRMVCEPEYPGVTLHPSPDDILRLRTRDQWLADYVDKKNLGHADLVAQLKAIPAQVKERLRFDAATFRMTYEEPKLFAWIWSR